MKPFIQRAVPVLGIVLVLIVGSGVFIRANTKKELQRELQTIRDRGFPASPLEVNAWYAEVSPAENSALGILRAHSHHVEPGNHDPKGLSDGLVLGQAIPPKLAAAIASLVQRNEESLTELHKAALLPKSRYPIDLTPGLTSLLPHLSPVKRMAELLKWDAIYRSADGNRTNALRAVESGFAVASSLKDEPVLISALVRMSCLWITIGSLERVLTEHELTREELDRLLTLVRAADQHCTASLRRGLLGERGSAIGAFDMSYKDLFGSNANNSLELKELLQMFKFEWSRLLGAHARDRSFYLSCMAEVEEALTMEFDEMVQEGRRIDESAYSAFQQLYPISHAVLPGVSGAIDKNALLIAQLRCILLALKIEKIRITNDGRIPTSEDIAKSISPLPEDPMDRKPLKFESLEKGYRILAEGATSLRTKRAGKSSSIAFQVLR